MPLMSALRLPVLTPLLLSACLWQPARAQSSCSSDGQSRPVALLERFISADCRDCWVDAATPRARPREIALDWVVPGSQGDDAPLSAVATRDGLKRLAARGNTPPAGSSHTRGAVTASPRRLRVAHGLPVTGYIGASIEYRQVPPGASAQPWSAWLALVETIPAGTEGTPVARNLVRNLVQATWNVREPLSKKEQLNFIESRSMDMAPGMNPDRLRVVGWVEDAQGRIVAAAQSRCVAR